MNYLREIIGKTKWDGIRNDHILKKILRSKLNWYGHIKRMDP